VFHRTMAMVATAFLLVHPVLVAWSEGWWLLTRWHVHWYVWAGRATLALLLIQAAVGLSRRVMRLSYERWQRWHRVFAPTLLALGFAHGLAAGDDAHGGGGLILWAAITAIPFACWLYSRAVRPRLLLRQPFRVMAVESEAPRVWTLTLEAPRNRAFH